MFAAFVMAWPVGCPPVGKVGRLGDDKLDTGTYDTIGAYEPIHPVLLPRYCAVQQTSQSNQDLHADSSEAHAKGKPRGKPFAPGNHAGKGRPPGSRNKKALLLQETLDDFAPSVIRKALKMAMEGDRTAMKLVVDRVLPTAGLNRIELDLPEVKTSADLLKVSGVILQATGQGEITVDQGRSLSEMLQNHSRLIDSEMFEQRLSALEQRGSAGGESSKLTVVSEAQQTQADLRPPCEQDGKTIHEEQANAS